MYHMREDNTKHDGVPIGPFQFSKVYADGREFGKLRINLSHWNRLEPSGTVWTVSFFWQSQR